MSKETSERQLVAISNLLQLEREARHAESVRALGFIMVNETRHLLDYQQAVLWRLKPSGGISIESVSDVSAVEKNAPFTRWLQRFLQGLLKDDRINRTHVLNSEDIEDDLHEGWLEWGGGSTSCYAL